MEDASCFIADVVAVVIVFLFLSSLLSFCVIFLFFFFFFFVWPPQLFENPANAMSRCRACGSLFTASQVEVRF